MAKDKVTTMVSEDEHVNEELVTGERERRRTTYMRASETQIPQEIVEMFAKKDWSLRWVRYLMGGDEDYNSLRKRVNEGYEFVQADELPAWYRNTLRIVDGRNRKGMVTVGDLCLMKADPRLIKSRVDFYQAEADRQAKAADLNTLVKTKGYIDQGIRSRVSTRDAGFQD